MKGFDVDRYTFKVALTCEVLLTSLFIWASVLGESIPRFGNFVTWLGFSFFGPFLALYISFGPPSQTAGYYWLKYLSAVCISLWLLASVWMWHMALKYGFSGYIPPGTRW